MEMAKEKPWANVHHENFVQLQAWSMMLKMSRLLVVYQHFDALHVFKMCLIHCKSLALKGVCAHVWYVHVFTIILMCLIIANHWEILL